MTTTEVFKKRYVDGLRNPVPTSAKVQRMLDFKAGRKPATIMHQLSKGYSDEQIVAIAGYFAAQKK